MASHTRRHELIARDAPTAGGRGAPRLIDPDDISHAACGGHFRERYGAWQIQRAFEQVDSLDILINNAGVSVPDDLSDRSAFEQHLAVNLYGTLDVTQAFLPSLTRSQGAVVNVVSVGALAAVLRQ